MLRLPSCIATVVVVAAGALLAPTSTVAQDQCQVCGCSFCPTDWEVTNPEAMVKIPEEIKPLLPASFASKDTVQCSLIDLAGVGGLIPNEFCTDQFRLHTTFRNICGCPEPPVRPTEVPTTELPLLAFDTTDVPTRGPTMTMTTASTPVPTAGTPTSASDTPSDSPSDMPSMGFHSGDDEVDDSPLPLDDDDEVDDLLLDDDLTTATTTSSPTAYPVAVAPPTVASESKSKRVKSPKSPKSTSRAVSSGATTTTTTTHTSGSTTTTYNTASESKSAKSPKSNDKKVKRRSVLHLIE